MADLSDQQAAQTVALTGTSSAGQSTYWVGATSDNALLAQQVGFGTLGTNAQVSVGTTSTTLLAANSNRRFAYVANTSTQPIYIMLDATAVVGRGITLPPGSVYEIGNNNLWKGSVVGIKGGGGTVNVDVYEATA